MNWIIDNAVNIAVCGVIIICAVLATVKIIKDKKKGKGGCGGNCNACLMKDKCRKN